MSAQDFAVATQKFTWPTVSGVDPAVTVAVSVITLPEVTEDTGLELVPEVTASVVVVGVLVCAAALCQLPHVHATSAASPNAFRVDGPFFRKLMADEEANRARLIMATAPGTRMGNIR
jgi:uncharacterized membrane protein YhhN